MTLQQMEYIVAVDKYRHFAKAAESCGVSQSTLSSLIQKLEYELDVTIFDRNSHPVKPTALGAEIINRVKSVLFNAAQVRELVSARKGESVGTVSLGITSTVAPCAAASEMSAGQCPRNDRSRTLARDILCGPPEFCA